jgi:peptidoglycan/LPS O-acetylase OafA/YrhL
VLAAGFLAVLPVLSSVTYYLVEAPMRCIGPDRLAPADAPAANRVLAGGPLRRDDDT